MGVSEGAGPDITRMLLLVSTLGRCSKEDKKYVCCKIWGGVWENFGIDHFAAFHSSHPGASVQIYCKSGNAPAFLEESYIFGIFYYIFLNGMKIVDKELPEHLDPASCIHVNLYVHLSQHKECKTNLFY